MQSRLITIDATRVTMDRAGWTQRASGEPIYCYTLRKKEKRQPQDGGVILRLDDYRENLSSEAVSTPQLPQRGGYQLSLALECVATAAILVLVLGTLIRFFIL